MPKRPYLTENHLRSYESNSTKLARIQAEIASENRGDLFRNDDEITEDMILPHENEDEDYGTTRKVNTNPNPVILQEVLQTEAPVHQHGQNDSDDDYTYEDDSININEQEASSEDHSSTHSYNHQHEHTPFDNSDSIEFSLTDHAMVDLIQCCNKAGTSIKFLDDLLRTLKRHVKKGFDILKAPKRSNFMASLRKRLDSPTAEIVASPSGHIVPRHNLLDQLLDLFSTNFFQDVESCCVNLDDAIRFLQYIPTEEEGNTEVLSGHWSRTTYNQYVRDNPTYIDPDTGIVYINWLAPLLLYNDKTGVGAMEGKYTLEPLMFTLAVLRREIREKAEAWRHLGFIPKHNAGTGSKDDDEDNEADAEERLALFHELLGLLLESVQKLQKEPPLLHIKLFGKMVHVRPILEVAFVIGDQLSQDHHCGRKKVNSGGASRAHRSCMCSFENAGDEDHQCHPVDQKIVQKLTQIIHNGQDTDKRKAICIAAYPEEEALPPRHASRVAAKKNRNSLSSFLKVQAATAREILEKTFGLYPIQNAWFNISFGATANGIYEAALDDPFHFSEAGLFMYLIKIAFKGLLPADAKKMEKYMREDFSPRSSVRYDFPRGKFSPGFTNCTLLTGSEKVGLVHSLYLSLGTKRVQDIYTSNIIRQQAKYLDHNICYEALGFHESSLRPSPLLLPKIWDQYYFVDIRHKNNAERAGRTSEGYELPRNKRTIKKVVDHLDAFGLLFVVDPDKPPLDRLQTEYLVQAVWHRTARKQSWTFEHNAQGLLGSFGSETSEVGKELATQTLFSHLRRGTPPLSYHNRTTQTKAHVVPSAKAHAGLSHHLHCSNHSGTAQKSIRKHCIQKPKIKGRGETSAILTDVAGFRQVLEYALVYHSIVHEFHQLDFSLTKDISNLDRQLRELMSVILTKIYRGDNSVDTNTCKIHSHFHLAEATKNFGAPMNYDASKGERGLKSWAIHASKTARKCGDAMFITQTASRVTDHLLLSKTKRLIVSAGGMPVTLPDAVEDKPKWSFTRASCHVKYDLQSQTSLKISGSTSLPIENGSLLLPQIRQVLKREHGQAGTIEIWREICVRMGGGAKNYIRAFHTYDNYGSYFDWAQIKPDPNSEVYMPCKVLLLYRLNGECNALCWKALEATTGERNKETNISARWKMPIRQVDGLPEISRVPIENLTRCLYVFEHVKSRDHIPTVSVPQAERSDFVVDESYDRYSWALNFLDTSRWDD